MNNEHAIAAATDNFYAALNILFTGDSQPMKDAWSHDKDVVYMGPDGLYLIGWEKVAKMWDEVAAIRLSGQVYPQQLHTVIGNDMALITCVEMGENNLEGKAETVAIRSSTVFHKRQGAWKIVSHQTDLLGYMN